MFPKLISLRKTAAAFALALVVALAAGAHVAVLDAIRLHLRGRSWAGLRYLSRVEGGEP